MNIKILLIVAAIVLGMGGLALWNNYQKAGEPPQVVSPPELVVPPVYVPEPAGTVGEGPSSSQPQPVYPPVSVPPVYTPEASGTVGEGPSEAQPKPVYPVDVWRDLGKPPVVVSPPSEPIKLDKEIIEFKVAPAKPRAKKPRTKKRRRYVSHEVKYPKDRKPDFYPKQYWKK